MAIHPGVRAPSHPASPLGRLVEERGLRSYAFFLVTGEGSHLPNGDEEKSGYVVGADGRVYSFWTGWDTLRDETVFTEWEQVVPDVEWVDEPEYQRACAVAGVRPRQARVLGSSAGRMGNRIARFMHATSLIATGLARDLADLLATIRARLGR